MLTLIRAELVVMNACKLGFGRQVMLNLTSSGPFASGSSSYKKLSRLDKNDHREFRISWSQRLLQIQRTDYTFCDKGS